MKKYIAMFLAVIMIVGMLTGCGGTNEESRAPVSADPSVSGTQVTESAAPEYPTKGIELVVCVSAGGTPDVMSRVAADWLSKYWDVPITVTNKPGGGAIPGALEALSAANDGYTVCAITSQNSSQQHGANKTPSIDVTEPVYLCRVFDVDLALTVNAAAEWETVQEFNEWALANPDKIIAANTGAVSTAAFATAEWYSKLGGDVSSIRMMTTSGGSDSATQLAGGNCTMNFGDFGGSRSMVEAGKIRYMATSAKERNPYYPDVPTFEESGLTGLSVGMWIGYMAPEGTPDYVVDAWNEAVTAMIEDPEFQVSLENVRGRTAYLNSGDFRELIMDECETYTELAEALGVRK